ncbi:Bifunctional lycopene cyclase/phytoene synthase [Phlyctema vagabunda]|uniref:Bifunctional lycopene cyclase/phytoene synthase n=1 Tax=Phlyctema vagabunda TaxID=108571 RepID=A0ABR4PA35_9HELO
MGFEYALVHLKYTIPPAIVLTYAYRPFFSRIDIYKILFLVVVAIVATIPWDSYLIRRKIWTYPPHVIIGPSLFSIPAEEVFFFFIQTYDTTLIYLLLNKPILHSVYLRGRGLGQKPPLRKSCAVGQLFFASLICTGAWILWKGGRGTYMGLILTWAGPFALFLWSLSYQFLVGLPYTSTVVPIVAPTLYLWVVDTIALRRGTWSIESGTKFGIHLWEGLEIEEAVFFLATNILVVFGLVAFDNAMAILLTFPSIFPTVPALPAPALMVKALLTSTTRYDLTRVRGISQAANRLQRKSRSFYLASSVFSGRLRIDLVLLYSFCRVADDLVDESSTEVEARKWITKLTEYLDLAYESPKDAYQISDNPKLCSYITANFPESIQTALRLLPTHLLSSRPLYELLEGFKTDLEFHESKLTDNGRRFPIEDESELERYCACVAGTIGELCLELVFHHTSSVLSITQKEQLRNSGRRMGIALQRVNIARDIVTDATIGRVYLPTIWLGEAGLTPRDVLKRPSHPTIEVLRSKLLKMAFLEYRKAQGALSKLPVDARAPMRVAVESYMEIGRVLSTKGYKVKEGKATVPKLRRLEVAWKALKEG